MVCKGIFLMRFQDQDSRSLACDMNRILFDKKPFIVRQWVPSISYEKYTLSSVPIWVRFPSLDVRYLGVFSLTEIVGMLGSVLKLELDGTTSNKGRLMYARVLVDINIAKGFCDEIFFENELGDLTSQRVAYD